MRAANYVEQLQRLQAAAQILHQLCGALEQELRKARRSSTIDTDLNPLRHRCRTARSELDHLLAAVAEAQEGRKAVTGDQLASTNLRQIRTEIITLKGQVENGTEDIVELVEDVCQALHSEGHSRPSATTRRTEVRLQLPRDDSRDDRDASA
ncbi:hypothetical protein IM697_24040 [Streptomyces ferrugineus]|uniref:Uncharacterized protein n=1 Tax=Streptomyces ferrugineus TaxID=1413221 RepID=A0A7M2SC47_9ACTN|nr:hypothetical protein [Streptomyces ferrugineus]QOV33305.1 hypothetical protein IM697_24040 [Streptomyces ferrugineus]